MTAKAQNRITRVCLTLYSIEILFSIFGFPGGAVLSTLVALLVALLFVPSIFFLPNQQMDQYYSSRSVKIAQGFMVIFILLAPRFKLMHYPGASLLTILATFSFVGLLLSLKWTHHTRVTRPNIIIVILFVLLSFFQIFTFSVTTNNLTQDLIQPYVDIHERLIKTKEHYESMDDRFHSQLVERSEMTISLIDSIYSEVIRVADQVPEEVADTLTALEVSNKENFDVVSQIMVGPDATNPRGPEEAYSAARLKASLKHSLAEVIAQYTMKGRQIDAFMFDGYEIEGFHQKWELNEFYHQPLFPVLTKLELWKYLLYTEMIYSIREKQNNGNAELIKLKRERISELFHKQQEQFSSSASSTFDQKGSFELMRALTFLIVIIVLYTPKFKISEKWKTRILLFCVVIVFEFILLVTDFYIGIFSQNPAILMLVNVFLALGLVSLDNFLRNNFLKWYEET